MFFLRTLPIPLLRLADVTLRTPVKLVPRAGSSKRHAEVFLVSKTLSFCARLGQLPLFFLGHSLASFLAELPLCHY